MLAARRLRGGTLAEAGRLLRAANLPFCGFVFALGVVVLAVRAGPIGDAVRALVPARADFAGLLTAAVLAAVLANLLNNLPATLMVVPLVAGSPGLVMAVLLGVNLGPNLTYVGIAGDPAVAADPARPRPSADGTGVPAPRRPHRPGRSARRGGGVVVEPDSLRDDVRDGAP